MSDLSRYSIWHLDGDCVVTAAIGDSPAGAFEQACERSPQLFRAGKYIVAIFGDPYESPAGRHQAAALFERVEVSVPRYANRRVLS